MKHMRVLHQMVPPGSEKGEVSGACNAEEELHPKFGNAGQRFEEPAIRVTVVADFVLQGPIFPDLDLFAIDSAFHGKRTGKID